MNAVIINFETLRQEHHRHTTEKKQQIIFECQKDIINSEEQIRMLVQQINNLQSNIDMNYRLIAEIKQP